MRGGHWSALAASCVLIVTSVGVAMALWLGHNARETRDPAADAFASEGMPSFTETSSANAPQIDRHGERQRIQVCCEDRRGKGIGGATVALRANGVHIAEARADAEGKVELELPPSHSQPLEIAASAPGFVQRGRVLDSGGLRSEDAQCVILLPRPETLFGRVIDPEGRPLPDISVTTDFDTAHLEDLTRRDGTFAFATRFPPGMHEVLFDGGEAFFDGHLEIDGSGSWSERSITLRPRRTITGVVRDEEGEPLREIPIYGDGATNRPETQSDEDGSFVLDEPEAGSEGTHLEIPAGSTQAWRTSTAIAWGSTGVVLTPARTYEVLLRVISAASSDAIEGYGVHVTRAGAEPSARSFRAHNHYPDGVARVDRLQPGESFVHIVPREPLFAPSPPIRVHVGSEPASREPLVVELEDAATLVVHVFDGSGVPVRDAVVELLSLGPAADQALWVKAERNVFGWLGPSSAGALHVDGDRTNADGCVALRFPAHCRRMAVRAEHPGHAPAFREGAFATNGHIELDLHTGGRVQFELEPKSAATLIRYAWLKPRGAHPDTRPCDCIAPRKVLDARVVFQDLPAGEYQLGLSTPFEDLIHPSVGCTVALGEQRNMSVDLAELDVTTLDVSIEVPLDQIGWRLHYSRANREGSSASDVIQLDRSGKATDVPLLPGEYVFWLQDGTGIGNLALRAAEKALLRYTGAEPQTRPLRSLRVHVKGFASEGSRPSVISVDYRRAKLDADGSALLEPAPSGPFRIRFGDCEFPEDGRFVPPPGDESWSLHINLR